MTREELKKLALKSNKEKQAKREKKPLADIIEEVKKIDEAKRKRKEKREQDKQAKLIEEELKLINEFDKKDEEPIKEKIQPININKIKKSNYDVPIQEHIEYFDPELSYELTGYRPITKTKGLDFDPKLFTEPADHYRLYNKYTQLLPGTFAHRNHWSQELERCKNGITINNYTLTGENYFFLNYYRLLSVLSDLESDEVRLEDFPRFFAKQYEYFHYIALAKKLGLDGLAFKARGVGFSEIAASNLTCSYTVHQASNNIVTAYDEKYVIQTLTKAWQELDFLNTNTEDAFRHLRMKVDTSMKKRASKVDSDKNESGWMSTIEGITADIPRKLRGSRANNVYFEEAGSNPQLIPTYTQSRALVEISGRRVGSRFVFGCVCAGTKVWTNSGEYKNIEELQQYEGIVGFKNGIANSQNILNFNPPAKKDCVKIILSDGTELKCSNDHPIYKKINNTWNFIEAEKLKIGDIIGKCLEVDIFGNEKLSDAYLIGFQTIDKLPYNYQFLTKEDSRLLLAGIFDKLGYINYKNKKIIIIKNSKFLLKEIQIILYKFGIHSNIYNKNKKYILIISKKFIENFKKNIPLKLKYKINFLNKIKFNNINTSNGIIECHVKSIKNIGKQYIYNLTASDSHTYLANNIITHNTGGDSGPNLEGLYKMFNNPTEYHILPYKHFYSKTGDVSYTGFFIPAYTLWYGDQDNPGYDSRGVVDEERAKKYYENQWSKIKDPKLLMQDKAEYCFTPEDAFALEGGGVFNLEKLSEQKMNIEQLKIVEKPQTAKLIWPYNKDKQCVDRDQIPQIKFDPNGKLLILETPMTDATGQPINNLYVIGVDGIDSGKDTSTGQKDVSKYAIIVFRRRLGLKSPKIVAIYKDRPDNPEEAHDTALKLAQFYNAKILFEATRVSIFSHFKRYDKLSYFLRRPKTTLTNKHQNIKQYGCPATDNIIDHQIELIQQYIYDYCEEINFIDVINELIRYSNAAKRKFDLVAALGMALLADEDMMGKTPKENSLLDKKIKNIGYYTNEYGQKVYGIIDSNRSGPTTMDTGWYRETTQKYN